MNTPITASFQWAPEELLLAQRLHLRHSEMGRKYRQAVFVVGPLAIIGGAGILASRGINTFGLVFLVLGTAMVMMPFWARRMTLKHYATRPDRDMLITWEFFPDRLDTKTPASSSTMEWKMISRVLRTAQGFLLYPNEHIFHWLPIHAFGNSQDVETFSQLAKSNVQQFDNRS